MAGRSRRKFPCTIHRLTENRATGTEFYWARAASRLAVELLVSAYGAGIQWYEAGLDHRRWIKVLQPANVRRHLLRRVGCEYLHHGGDHVWVDSLAAQQQVRYADRT